MSTQTKTLRPLDPLSELPLYRQVEMQIEELIRRENLQPRQPLPSLSVLCREMGVNHLTIRRAIRELAHRNVVVTRQGRGTFVAEGAVRKVLWVCGLNIFSGEISTYYTDLLRYTAEALEAHGIAVEPAWLSKDSPGDSQRFACESSARGYVGYLFSAAREHPLLDYVAATALPHVNMSFAPHERSRSVTYDTVGADRLAVGHLAGRGHRRISLLGFPEQASEYLPELGRSFGVELALGRGAALTDGAARASDVEHHAFEYTANILANGELADAVYIGDEVAARGVTRAMLAFNDGQQARDLVVRSARQEIIPLGLPVQYVAFDVREQAHEAVRVLMDQVNNVVGRPDYHICKYALHDPAATKRDPSEAVPA